MEWHVQGDRELQGWDEGSRGRKREEGEARRLCEPIRYLQEDTKRGKRNSNIKHHSLPGSGGCPRSAMGPQCSEDTVNFQPERKPRSEPLRGFGEVENEQDTGLIPQAPLSFLFCNSPILGLFLKASPTLGTMCTQGMHT